MNETGSSNLLGSTMDHGIESFYAESFYAESFYAESFYAESYYAESFYALGSLAVSFACFW